jgi:DNA-directed RNA polymerase specialized sigma24 family protein
MSTQFSTTVSLIDPNVHPATHRQLSRSTKPALGKPVSSEGQLNAAAFERFLCWLAPDRETAGLKYESIRGGLITMFKARRCLFAEDLADTTFERVARKLTALTTEFKGDPTPYFYGVAKKVYLEYQHEITAKHKRVVWSPPATSDDQELENMLDQLDEALSAIPKFDRELILKYYTYSGRNKIGHRRALANQFGLRPNALRLRVFRIRKLIKNHMLGAGAVRQGSKEISIDSDVSLAVQ